MAARCNAATGGMYRTVKRDRGAYLSGRGDQDADYVGKVPGFKRPAAQAPRVCGPAVPSG